MTQCVFRQTHRLVSDPCNLLYTWKDCIVHMRDCLWVYPFASQPLLKVCYLGRLVDCNRCGCDREADIDWHMSYTVTIWSLNPTQQHHKSSYLSTALTPWLENKALIIQMH